MKMLVLGIRCGAYALVMCGWMAAVRAQDSAPAIWKRHAIDAADNAVGKRGADGVRLGFADADSLPDVVTGWEDGDAIRVCFNPGPEGSKGPWEGITVGHVAGAEDAVFADLDANGVLDVVSCTEGKTRTVFVHWAPHPAAEYADESAWKTEAFPALKGKQMWMYCLPCDANGDGREDLILGSKNAGATVGWLEQPSENPRDLSRWKYHPLYEAGWIMSIRAEDLDGDGDRDVIFSDRKGKSTGVWWLENVGQGNGESGSVFAAPRRLGLAEKEVMFIDIADVNGDDRLDIAAAIKPDEIAFLFQPEGKASESWKVGFLAGGLDLKRFGTAKAVRVADLDLDGNLDAAITCENAKGALSGCLYAPIEFDRPVTLHDLGGPEGVKFDRIELIDLDGDGDLDLMTCEERDNLGVFWYENPSR
ncbi:MAG: VCBS repeat-containing protein [Verrucomicrobiae bacterium]|nr:VCBS repeat-containing protein [Verrucomicrobiae bacterium]